MFQIAFSIAFIIFGLFLKNTSNQGFQQSRRFSTFFIVIGILTLIGGMILMLYKSK
ncbi:hypothetical protein CHRY9390_02100 [Chryseobacterium aquaeductus]|uniref:DUF3953 domain-containing protein n=1 Tax=Chryseobacterium aquaeductus TaxID=2675056 RepID=A0A9N8MGK8_9FLAO|nr:hypothetical protein CHRY9390_02100 [Chryseobacterium potabilaquae]CAD7809971.1 hypothetical protein CHRY9390_02100 [Chryseobacterium aquaeductus]